MAGYPVVFVDAGGLPVTYGSDGNGWPIEEAASGLPVTIVASGGLPVVEGVGGWWLSGSVLDLDFANSRGYNSTALSSHTPDSILTYTSPSPKMVYGDDGVLGYAPHNLLVNSNWAGAYSGDDWVPTGWTSFVGTGGATAQTSVASPSDIAIRCSCTAQRNNFGLAVSVAAGDRFRFSFDLEAAPTPTAWNQLFATASVATTVDTYNGEATNGNLQPVAVGSRVYIDFTANAAGSLGIRFGCGVSGNVTADVTLARPMLQKLPFVGQEYVRNTSTTAAFYSLPLDHDPITFDPLGVLIEEQRTNLLLQSQTQTGPGWGFDASTGSGLTLDGGLGPNGVNQLCTFNEGTSTGAHRANRSVAIVAATAYTFSTYLRAGTSSYIAFGSNKGGIAIDTENWVITETIAPANTTVTNASLTQVAVGLYKASVTVSHTTDTTTFFVVSTAVTATPGTMTPSFAGTSRTAIFGFCQIEAGAFPTSYIPTVASQVTRAADQVSILTSAFAYNAAAGTMVAAARAILANSLGAAASVNDGTGNEEIVIYRDASGNLVYQVEDGGANQLDPLDSGQNAANLTEYKMAAAWGANDFAAAVNGNAAVTDTSGTLPTVTTLEVGVNQANNYFNGTIKRLTYFPTRRSNADLQVLSA